MHAMQHTSTCCASPSESPCVALRLPQMMKCVIALFDEGIQGFQKQQKMSQSSWAKVAVFDILCIYSHEICVQRASAGLSPLEALSFHDAAARFAVSQLIPITLGPTCLSLSFTT